MIKPGTWPKEPYAQVHADLIIWAGFIKGWLGKDTAFLVGRGLKGWPSRIR